MIASVGRNVADYLLEGKDPDRLALSLLDRDCSYGELQDAVQRLSGYSLRLGLASGDRAILIADNGTFWVSAYLGLLKAGLIAVPLPPAIPAEKLEYIQELTEAKLAIVQAVSLPRHAKSLKCMHLLTDRPARSIPSAISQASAGTLEVNRGPSGSPERSACGDDLAAIMFTSGSTGEPRGVMISHANIIANTESIIAYLGLRETDRMVAVLPFHYCFGTSLLHTHLRVGASIVVEPRFLYPEVVLNRMIETRCTGFAGVPTHFQILLRSSSLRQKSFPDLRYVQQAGGHLASTLLSDLREALPETRIFVMYGQTEATARLSYLPPEHLDAKLGSIGKAIPGVRLRVLDNHGADVKPGEVGEIVAEGANVARGYWRAPLETAETFRDGKLYTGDLATIDSDGFLYVVDRAKDFLKCRGERISCRSIEDVLLEYEDVVEVAVLGVPDEVLGEAVKAFAVPREGSESGLPERLEQFCRGRLPAYLVPKAIVFLPELPKNSAGKVLKASLR